MITERLLRLYRQDLHTCMDVISIEGQARSSFYHQYKDDISSYMWKQKNVPSIILQTMDDIELGRLKPFVERSGNQDSIKLINRELETRRIAKLGYNNDRVDLHQKKEEVPIMEVIENYVSVRGRRGSLIKCPLPDHADGSPSFSIDTKQNRFKCFGCQASGSQIDFIMAIEKCDLKTAITKFLTY